MIEKYAVSVCDLHTGENYITIVNATNFKHALLEHYLKWCAYMAGKDESTSPKDYLNVSHISFIMNLSNSIFDAKIEYKQCLLSFDVKVVVAE